ncbi:unnamed protein product [Toxocara canis]|uniref:Fibroin heavy chain-like n=1 Tax=Toxocara canis TaxID=6265 RepID=A0A183UIW2_TOXCA|nr:unnamed protein product [Toxocara canis]
MPSISPPHTPLPQPPPSPSVPSQPIDGTPPPAPLSQTSPQSNLLPQPSGSSPYEPSSGYVPVPAPETVAPLTAPTQTSTDLQTRANGISSPGAAGELPAGPSVYEGPVIYPSVPSLPVSSVVPAVPKYEIENQIASSRIEEPLPSPYGNEVEASVQVSDCGMKVQNISLSDSLTFSIYNTYIDQRQEPISNLKATVRTGSRVTEQKVGSRVETAKSGSGVYQTEEHVPAAIPQSPTPSVASNSLPPPTSSYGGSFGSGGLSAGFDGNVGNAQVDINSGGHGANYVGGSGGLVGLTGINSYSGPGSVGFGGPSGVPSISQGSYTTGEQSLRVGGQSLGGQLLGGQQNAYLVAPLRGTGGDGCCGGSWLSRSGGFCSPINFNPCLPALLPIPSCRCAPSQQQCQSSCMSSCCLPSLPGLCGRRKKSHTDTYTSQFCGPPFMKPVKPCSHLSHIIVSRSTMPLRMVDADVAILQSWNTLEGDFAVLEYT